MSTRPSHRRRPRRGWPATTALSLALLLAACTPGGGGADADPDDDGQAAADEATSDEGDEEVVLRVVDARAGEEAVQASFDRIDRAFEDRHPGVTVQRESVDLDELITTVNLRLSDQDVPDVTAVNMGHGTLGTLASSGLLVELDDYADEYGWWDRQSEVLLAMNGQHSADGEVMAEGPLWALSDTGAPIGVFYNQALLDDLGLDLPDSWEAFEQAIDVARDNGVTPVMFGNVDGWPGIHTVQHFLNDAIGREGVADFVYGEAPLEGDAPVAAAATAQEWVEQDAFVDGFEGLPYDSAVSMFADDEALFFPAGSWVAGDLAANNDDIRFFVMPRSEGEQPPVATSSGDFPWAIPANAQHPDLAAEYIDFRLSDEVAEMYIEDGNIPAVLPDGWEEEVEEGSLQADLLAAWEQLEQDEAMAPYLDWTTPDFYDVVTSEIQQLLADRVTPEEFVDTLNDAWADYYE